MARRSKLTGSAGTFTLQVQGLAALQRDLGKVNKSAKSEVREGLKEVGRIVQDDARLIAKAKGLHDTGQLIRKITPAVTQNAVFVRAKAMRDGYNYPAVYEFGGRAAQMKRKGPGMTAIRHRSAIGARLAKSGPALGAFGEYGPRAFLMPAAERMSKEVERAMERWLDSLLEKNSL